MASEPISFVFDHVHMYMKRMANLEEYLGQQELFTKFDNARNKETSIEQGRELFESLGGKLKEHQAFGLDVIEQLIAGFAMRIQGHRYGTETSTVLLTSKDPEGTKFLLTAPVSSPDSSEPLHFFKASKVQEFLDLHNGKQGIAVLAFRVPPNVTTVVLENYQKSHPKLVTPEGIYTQEEDGNVVRTLEVFAYYNKAGDAPDRGTRLRFIESGKESTVNILPGLSLSPDQAPEFPKDASPFYSDHWVSNVFDRESFLKNLFDTLAFTPKVNFNAGVVGAGEAVIESTVTGNDPKLKLTRDTVLRDQSQVYLPINNALSSVGHVHLFLEQLGQGVQHIASRVPSMVHSIREANISRKMTGHGFNFLNIPRSYYGTLSQKDLIKHANTSPELAKAIFDSLVENGTADFTGVVDLDVKPENVTELKEKFPGNFGGDLGKEFEEKEEKICGVVSKSRYLQLFNLLRDHVSEETYLEIVRNQILVDIQGNDILYQIFTGNILNEAPGDEAPFLEFIERVCSQKCGPGGCPVPVRPGCGGFGIRNFLTLFLSIEVSKAMKNLSIAKEEKDEKKAAVATQMIEVFTTQLNESNPILTEISDAMTEESDILDELKDCQDQEKRVKLETDLAAQVAIKEKGQEKLKETSSRYKAIMKEIREKSA
mmetsp:Transcript_6671/g.8906  ORF Transcript_6671/g.8906 Transcript_6671/m.8906 type:complete len:655 (-) Transcript_6671:258-2222(-)